MFKLGIEPKNFNLDLSENIQTWTGARISLTRTESERM